mmetsp:Transcript_15866/g.24031  ORF Transcript_15866/g.24031 Transcript_15866/m.24031 type:complete len:760 (-) Transcript_15866:981-3260(-)|eukprot:CAMPEP_0178898638 /NCGR_PEP_ID=MMETSP0786-20121207/2450_1 /TAXON_ID=186022 /ORGANISM="Thalassionema frauenfeldii, Strain CCMP 1798" /LENGTH=759 /DNA_ID=CAMNT_0020569395 /DNA_START=60 /DNA_END=2339 /DNA_ORIENTATION=+
MTDSLILVNAKEGCTDTLKALWASSLFGVSLKADESPDIPSAALVYGDILIQDGNSMAQAMQLCAAASPGYMESMQVEDWCEWEKTSMSVKNLTKLSKYLESSSPLHVVGNSMTIADICIVVKLSTMDVASLPPSVAKYLNNHLPAMEEARDSLKGLPVAGGVSEEDMNNPSAQYVVKAIFTAALKKLFGNDVELPKQNWVSRCSKPKDGDYQCSAAMQIYAALKKSGSLPDGMQKPQDVAQAIIKTVGDSNPVLMDLLVVGPGFVVCRLTPSFLEGCVGKLLSDGKLPKPSVAPSTCVVDFSSPNIAKEMHVGHLRSTIIGESVCRVLEFVGHKVHRVNHVGDWGTQFGMLIQYLKEEYPDFADSMPNITDLTQFYKNAKQRFDDSPEFKKTSQLNVVKLQSGDPECHKIWTILCDVSRKEFQKVYDRLDITVEECGESFYNSRIPGAIEEFEKKKLISDEEGGAKCVFVGEKFAIPLMLQKSDGGYGYDSTDIAALKYRLHTLKAKRIICITDYSQENHFKMCFAAADQVGWLNDKQSLEHIGFGTVQGEDGKRFKTRSGDTVRLVDLLDEAVRRMKESLLERIKEKKTTLTEESVDEVSEAIGYSAVKYFDLRRNPTSNYKFSYDQMLDTKGNTAVYLLFAYARLESIMAKAKADFNVDVAQLKDETVILGHPSERNLALHLQQFPDVIETTLEDLFPYHICDFVYNLSVAASDFVTQCHVLGSPEMKSRLLLCKATTLAMREAFDLVGIRHVQRI